MKLYIRGSHGGRNGLYSSELASMRGMLDYLRWPFARTVSFWAPNLCSIGQQRLVKCLLFHMNSFLIILWAWFIASPGQSAGSDSVNLILACTASYLCCTQTLCRMCTFSYSTTHELICCILTQCWEKLGTRLRKATIHVSWGTDHWINLHAQWVTVDNI